VNSHESSTTTPPASSPNSSPSSSKAARSSSSPPSASRPHGRLTSCTPRACCSACPRTLITCPGANANAAHRSGNIVGHPRHVTKALASGADLIIAQGGEAGGHTGDIATSILVPACADLCARHTSRLTGRPVVLVAAGGVNDGRSVASALMLGASGVWVGTRFIVAAESKAAAGFKEE
jgi:hypothetical protein